MKAWPVLPIAIVQTFLCLAHWFLYRTWIDFWWPLSPAASFALRIALAALSILFVVAAILSFQFSNPAVRFFYWIASVWLGISNFFFVGACFAWLADLGLRLILPGSDHLAARPYIAGTLVVASLVAALYGIFNARNIRQRRPHGAPA